MGYNTACVHRLAGFKAVKTWHDRTKPIRGNKDNIRPLGSRRHHYMADIHMPNEDTVQLRYYGQTLVEWRSNNTYTVFPPKYYSAYTPDNIHNFLPNHGQGFLWDRGRMFYTNAKEVYELPRLGGTRLEFQFVDGKSFLLNAPVAYNVRAKRNALQKIYPIYEGFMSWAQVVLAVTETFSTEEFEPSFDRFTSSLGFQTTKEYLEILSAKVVTPELREAVWDERYAREALPFGHGYNDWRRGAGFNKAACEKVRQMLLSPDPQNWVDVLHIAVAQAGTWTWSNKVNGRKFKTEACLNWVRTLLSYLHRDEVFDRVRLPKGTMPSRTNNKFFHDNQFTPRKLRHGVDESNVK